MIHDHLIVVYLSLPINPKHINRDVLLLFYDGWIIQYFHIFFFWVFSYFIKAKSRWMQYRKMSFLSAVLF